MKRLFALVFCWAITTSLHAQNPYEIFGRNLDTDPEIIQASSGFTLTNVDTAHQVRKLAINQQKNEVALIDKQGDTLLAQPLTPDIRLRWFTTDPVYQYFSPYVGIGNNPIRNIDPDGGNTYTIDKDGNIKYLNSLGGSSQSIVHSGTWQDGTFVAENTYFFESNEGNTLTAFDQYILDNNLMDVYPAGMGTNINSGQAEYVPTFELAFLPAALPFRTGSVAADFALSVANPIGGFRGVGGAASGGREFLFNSWHKGTFPNRTQSVLYHVSKHGNGRSAIQYTDDAMNFFNANKGLGQNVILKDGVPGIKIQLKPIINGKVHRIGGYWTSEGKLVTFWD